MPEKKHYWVTFAGCGQIFNHIDADDPVEACRLLDRRIDLEVEEYCAFPMEQRPDRSAYWVHQAPTADWRPAEDKDTDDEVAALPLVTKVVRRGAVISPPSQAMARVVAILKSEQERLELLEAKKKMH